MVKMLKKKVWDVNRCSGCGMCVSTCAKNVIHFPEDSDQPILEVKERNIGLSHVVVDTCFFCEKPCEESCPRLKEWEDGPVIRIISAVSKLPGSDVIDALLISALRCGLIDGAILWDVERSSFKPLPRVATSEDEILKSAGYQHLWFPVLTALNDAIYGRGLRKIAIVGPPCVAQAVKTVLSSTNKKLEIYRERIRLTIGLFCDGIYSYQLVTNEIVNRFNIKPYDINTVKVDLRNALLRIIMHDGSEKTIPLSDVRKYMRDGCARCTDFTSEWADLSVGDLGSEKGKTTVIVRTPIGENCLDYAIREGTIEIAETPVNMEEIQRFVSDKKRREQAQEVDSLLSSTLDALSGKKSREEIEEMLKSIGRK
ncbi:MAG: Coenzyme F420 hydrogenase/dehydrogenase, beta subunit C-terminal domain [Candidatus Baldrarchaeia archaeon]